MDSKGKDAEMDEEEIKQEEVVDDAGIEYTDIENLKEIEEETEELVKKVMDMLVSEFWKDQFYAFDELRRLFKYRQADFDTHLARYSDHIIAGVENLRSSICRNSMNLIVEVFN